MGYVMDDDQIVERARQASVEGRPSCTSSAGCTTSCRLITMSTWSAGSRRPHPEIHLKAYTAVEIEWFCKLSRQSVEQVLQI